MYQIQVLDDTEFDRLPYKYAKEALGCADPKTNTAYVRKIHWGEIGKTMTLLTIQHEMDELLAKISPHEEDGIRYKKGGVLRTILPIAAAFVPVIGPYLSAAMNIGMGQYAQSRHPEELGKPSLLSAAVQGISGYTGGQAAAGAVKGWGAAAGQGAGIGGKLGAAVQGGITGTYTNPATGAGMSLLGPGGKAVGLLGPTTSASMGLLKDQGTLLSSAATGGAAGGAGAGGMTAENVLKGLTNPLSMLGLGTMGMAALPTTTTAPAMGDIVAKWLSADTVTKAGAVAKSIADVEYTGEFTPSKEIQAYIEVMGKDIDKAYKQRATDLDRMGLAMSDQFMTSGERLEMHRRLAEEGQAEKDKMQSQWLLTAKQEYSQNQYNYVMNQLNADEATKRDLLYGELSDVIWKYNIAEADLMNFRQIAADAGMYMLSQGMGLS
jgi:hypothetical protein